MIALRLLDGGKAVALCPECDDRAMSLTDFCGRAMLLCEVCKYAVTPSQKFLKLLLAGYDEGPIKGRLYPDMSPIDEVYKRLPKLQSEDERHRDSFNRDIRRKLRQGWSLGDIVAHMKCSEHFSPDLPEDEALARMKAIQEKYKDKPEARVKLTTPERWPESEGYKEYEVWMEGFAATGQSGPASRKGSARAKSFKEACCILFKGDNLFNEESLTYWGCKLFDNEASARKSFG